MRVAIVHELLVKMGGAERVAKLFADLFPEAPVYTLVYDQKACGEAFPASRVHAAPFLQKAFSRGIPWRMMTGWMNTAIEQFDFSGFDLVLSSSSAFAHGVLTGPQTHHLCYCHSPARYLWDSTFAVQREQADRGFLAPLKKLLLPSLFFRLRQWDMVAATRADTLLANSRTVQERIQKYWRRSSFILFPPVQTHRFQPQKKHSEYFLIVSALSPFKNIDLAVRVFSRLPKHKLIIIGEGSEKTSLQKIAAPHIEFLGKKSDAVVREYLQNCRAFLFPSFDDFGIAPVEAMAAGKPVIALHKGGARETIVSGKTGIFFEETTEKDFENALVHFFEQESQFDANQISEHAAQFSEEHFRKGFQEIVEREVFSSKPSPHFFFS